MVNQTKLVSLIEAMMNVLTGFWISWAVWIFIVVPLFGFDAGYIKAFSITTIFTVSSLARAYIIRRWFNDSTHIGAEAVGRMVLRYIR